MASRGDKKVADATMDRVYEGFDTCVPGPRKSEQRDS